MLKKIDTILFTSNLSENSRSAFNHAALLATQFKAKIVLLHVIEQKSGGVENRAIGLFGYQKWQEILKEQMDDAHRLLVGKVTPNEIIRAALSGFCRETGIEHGECGRIDHEIVILKGDEVEEILKTSKAHDCDVIVMAAAEGLISQNSVGSTIKSVLKDANVPVVVIPPSPVK